MRKRTKKKNNKIKKMLTVLPLMAIMLTPHIANGQPPIITETDGAIIEVTLGNPYVDMGENRYAIYPGTPIMITLLPIYRPGMTSLLYRIESMGDEGEWTDITMAVQGHTAHHTFTIPEECHHQLSYHYTGEVFNEESQEYEHYDIYAHNIATFYVTGGPPHINKEIGEPIYILENNEGYYATNRTPVTIDTDFGCLPGGRTYINNGSGKTEITGMTPYTHHFTDECTHWLNITATDIFGRTSYENETFHIDNHAPAIHKTITGEYREIQEGKEYGAQQGTSITVTVTGGHCPAVMTRYNTGGGWNTIKSLPFTYTFEEECTHWINITTNDLLGQTRYDNQTFHIDSTPPSTWMTWELDYYNQYINQYTEFIIEGEDPICPECPWALNYMIDGPDNSIYNSGTSFTACNREWRTTPHNTPIAFQIRDENGGIQDGSYTIEFYGTDCAGNTEEAIHRYTFHTDIHPPVTRIRYMGNTYNGSDGMFIDDETRVILEGEDLESGLKIIKYRTGDDQPSWTYEKPFTIEQEGKHDMTYYGRDWIGNTEKANRETVTVDTTPPETHIALEGDTYIVNGETIITEDTLIHMSPIDMGSGIRETRYRIGNGEWQTPDGHGYIKTPLEEPAEIEYYSTDNMGNTEETQNISLSIDIQNPRIHISTPCEGYLTIYGRPLVKTEKTILIGKATLEMDASDDTQIKRMAIYIDDEPRTQSTTGHISFEWNTFSLKKHTIQTDAEDITGKTTTKTLEVLYLNL